MVSYTIFFIMLTFTSSSLLLVQCGAHAVSKQLHATPHYIINSSSSTCHDGYMSVFISKKQFADLPFTIYVQDEHGGYYQALAVAKQCLYVLGETETFIILTAASHGCFVKRQNDFTKLTVVIMAYKGRLEIAKTIPVICERKIKGEMNKHEYPLVSRNVFCNKDGFEVKIPRNATVPPLDLDTVWIPSSQSANCKPHKRSKEAVTFRFPFTDCGAQSMTGAGVITYSVNMEVKQQWKKGSIFHNSPFNLTVHCSFMLSQTAQLDFNVQGETSKDLSTLKSEGTLRAEMRFAKDSNYRSFYSSRHPPVTKLGFPVYVEVFVLKHEDKDLVLVLKDCWATPTENPLDTQRWNLLVKGCPFSGDSHKTVVLPVVSSKERKYASLHQWFVVKMFSFVKPLTFKSLDVPVQVYFHCDIEICKGPGCSQSCSSGRRKSRWITPSSGQRILYSVVSGGPLLYLL
nr:zona pellucida sperm-binding protein 4-like isoform X1 [Labrus bergylta]